eukprot:GDKJ01027413.1.p1 GENE.GDKJ01027413.1~~GDKJ01027413.1.p1  ORF type:complete len:600 (+),score=114.04 GDKJ01027413.1:239-1801(+)
MKNRPQDTSASHKKLPADELESYTGVLFFTHVCDLTFELVSMKIQTWRRESKLGEIQAMCEHINNFIHDLQATCFDWRCIFRFVSLSPSLLQGSWCYKRYVVADEQDDNNDTCLLLGKIESIYDNALRRTIASLDTPIRFEPSCAPCPVCDSQSSSVVATTTEECAACGGQVDKESILDLMGMGGAVHGLQILFEKLRGLDRVHDQQTQSEQEDGVEVVRVRAEPNVSDLKDDEFFDELKALHLIASAGDTRDSHVLFSIFRSCCDLKKRSAFSNQFSLLNVSSVIRANIEAVEKGVKQAAVFSKSNGGCIVHSTFSGNVWELIGDAYRDLAVFFSWVVCGGDELKIKELSERKFELGLFGEGTGESRLNREKAYHEHSTNDSRRVMGLRRHYEALKMKGGEKMIHSVTPALINEMMKPLTNKEFGQKIVDLQTQKNESIRNEMTLWVKKKDDLLERVFGFVGMYCGLDICCIMQQKFQSLALKNNFFSPQTSPVGETSPQTEVEQNCGDFDRRNMSYIF